MRLDFVNKRKRSETKALVGIENPWVQSPRVSNKKLPITGEFFNGDPNAMNLELLLTSDYYQATLERYEEIKRFEEVREAL